METAVPALILVTLLLVAVLTVAQTYLSSQDALFVAWQEMDERLTKRYKTDLALIQADTLNGGSVVEITVKNEGETKLADYDEWDVVLNYYTEWITKPYRIEYFPYSAGIGDDQWTVTGIYSDASESMPEVYEPGILNPGEEMVVWVRVNPSVGTGTTNLATVATLNGITASTVFTR